MNVPKTIAGTSRQGSKSVTKVYKEEGEGRRRRGELTRCLVDEQPANFAKESRCQWALNSLFKSCS